jgi:tetratricopeptide (TPR) repeat protein
MVFAEKSKTKWLDIAVLITAVIVAYFKVFHAGFMNWDDGDLVLHNPDIRSINGHTIYAWSSQFYLGNYHPLTLFSYALDFAMGKTQPFIYHFTNVLLHCANTCLLYIFIKRLRQDNNVALFVALIFALHPSQTESVSWIAERKTVLSAIFYLLALIRYTAYVRKPSVRGMAAVILLGIGAMLSKATAVALPLSLIAVDIWMQRSFREKSVWLEKLPLFLLALIIGITAIRAQASGRFMDVHAPISAFDTILYAGYAYMLYIVHLFVPVNLSAMYPYPTAVGWPQYLFCALAVGVISLAVIAWRRKWTVLCGGILFYSANIVFVLQFVQFGESLMADRYMYLASIGLLYPAVYYLFQWLRGTAKESVAKFVGGTVAVLFLALTFLRNDIWLSDYNFFNALLDAFPNSAVAQYSAGAQFMMAGENDKAEIHLSKAVELDPNNYKAWHNKGVLHLRQGRYMEALDALNRSIAINDYYKAYFTRAMLYQATQQPKLAISDIDKVLEVQPDNARALFIKGDCLGQLGNANAALDNYNKAIQYDDKEPIFYMRRGLLYAQLKQQAKAINDLNSAVGLNPGNGEALFYRGTVKHQFGLNACDDLRQALKQGYMPAERAIAAICK